MRFSICFFFLLITSGFAFSQTGNNSKQKQLEDIKKQLIEEQKSIQQQNEWHNQDAQQEIKKQSQEIKQKDFEIAATKQDAQTSKQEAQRAKAELASKKAELEIIQSKIDSANAHLAQTEALLHTAEVKIARTQDSLRHQEDSVKLLNQTNEFQQLHLKANELELENQRAKSRLYIIVAAVSLSLLSIIAILFFARQKTLRELNEKNKIIEEEKKRSDDLLLNILPEEVMNELKAHGKTQARNYHKATVLFADIRDFTGISEQLSPDELIEALDDYFEAFDKVIERFGIEKIKTIGDAYVCAGGVPTKSEDNPHLVVEAALDFIKEINKKKAIRSSAGKMSFEFRIGIHTGQLVAGVIGIRKFAYDIWGDTVNMAARMQQHGEPGKINISGVTYELVKNRFACVYRGKIEAKNKGEIDMYFVEKAIA